MTMEVKTSADAYRALQLVAEASGKQKIEVLKSFDDSGEVLKEVLRQAYDPSITFGIKKIPPFIQSPFIQSHEGGDFDTEFGWSLLRKLANRELTGSAAIEEVGETLNRLEDESARLLAMILNKDLRAGINVSTINKAFPKLIPVFKCMLAKPYDPTRIKSWPMAVEPKLDGVRTLALIKHDEVRFMSRTGKEFTSFDHIAEPLLIAAREAFSQEGTILRGIVVDGEMVSGSFNQTVSRARRKNTKAEDAVFNMFDILTFEQFFENQKSQIDYSVRHNNVRKLHQCASDDAPIKAINRYMVNSHEEIMTINESIRAKGGEGVIVKPMDHHYECKRSYSWMKIKAEETADLRVIGFFEGTGKYENNLGGLLVNYNGKEVRVGGGFSDEQRREIWELLQEDRQSDYSLYSGELGEENSVFRYFHGEPLNVLGRLIEVEYHEETPDGSLRHPRFVRWRDDKDAEAA